MITRLTVRVLVPVTNRVAHLHTTAAWHKYLTNTELVHRATVYGRKGYPARPNDARVPSNPQFGLTLLDREPVLGSEPSSLDPSVEKNRQKSSISRAMKVYLERAQKHAEFIREQDEEFEMGRRHLSNMMGLNLATMTQDDIDVSQRWLSP